MEHVEENYYINPGFRCICSCDTQLAGLLYDLTSSYDHGTQSDLKLLDTQLLYKLSWYSICNQTLQ